MNKSPRFSTRRFSIVSAALAATLALPAYGWAQTAPAPAPAAPAPAAPAAPPPATPAPSAEAAPTHMGHHTGHTRPFNLTEAVERHITSLHKELGITAAEEPQWNQFAQVMRDNAQQMSKSLEDRAKQAGTMNAVDSMTSYAQLAEQRSQDLMKLATAFQTLYGSMSDEQKKAADVLFRRQAERHGPHHG